MNKPTKSQARAWSAALRSVGEAIPYATIHRQLRKDKITKLSFLDFIAFEYNRYDTANIIDLVYVFGALEKTDK